MSAPALINRRPRLPSADLARPGIPPTHLRMVRPTLLDALRKLVKAFTARDFRPPGSDDIGCSIRFGSPPLPFTRLLPMDFASLYAASNAPGNLCPAFSTSLTAGPKAPDTDLAQFRNAVKCL